MRFQVVPAAYVLLLRDRDGGTEILLQLREGTGYMDGHWAAAAAGHVEADESVLDAGRREAAEELGITIDTGALEPLCAMHRTGGNGLPIDERVDFFFACRSWRGRPELQETEKAAQLDWFDLAALPDPVVPHELQVITALRDGTLQPIVTHGF